MSKLELYIEQVIDQYKGDTIDPEEAVALIIGRFSTEVAKAKKQLLEKIYRWRTPGTVKSVSYARSVIRADAVKAEIATLTAEVESNGGPENDA